MYGRKKNDDELEASVDLGGAYIRNKNYRLLKKQILFNKSRFKSTLIIFRKMHRKKIFEFSFNNNCPSVFLRKVATLGGVSEVYRPCSFSSQASVKSPIVPFSCSTSNLQTL